MPEKVKSSGLVENRRRGLLRPAPGPPLPTIMALRCRVGQPRTSGQLAKRQRLKASERPSWSAEVGLTTSVRGDPPANGDVIIHFVRSDASACFGFNFFLRCCAVPPKGESALLIISLSSGEALGGRLSLAALTVAFVSECLRRFDLGREHTQVFGPEFCLSNHSRASFSPLPNISAMVIPRRCRSHQALANCICA